MPPNMLRFTKIRAKAGICAINASRHGDWLRAACRRTAPRFLSGLARHQNQDNRRRRREMNLGLKGKSAVVTGSTAGIGLAIAAALAEEGAAVIVNGRTEARVKTALDAIRGKSKDAQLRGVAADLGTAAGCAEFIRQVPETD